MGGVGTTYILPPNIGGNNVFFSIIISKVWGQPPTVPLHRNSTRQTQVYSYQLEVTHKANNNNIKIGSALDTIWWFQFLKTIDRGKYKKEMLICYSYSYFVQVNVLPYIKNM